MSNPTEAFGLKLGDRIELVSMGDDPDPMEPGAQGTVNHLYEGHGLDQIGVTWDNGRGLLLVPGVDIWRKLEDT